MIYLILKQQKESPFIFDNYHKQVREPFDYYEFGIDLIKPLIDTENSSVIGIENLDKIKTHLDNKENVILFSNHQIEADPHAISILLEKNTPNYSEDFH